MEQENLFENKHYDLDDVFETEEELAKNAEIEPEEQQEPRMIDVNEVVEQLIRLDELEEIRKKAAQADDDIVETEVTKPQVALIAGLIVVLLILCTVIFVVPRVSTALLVSQAADLQEQLSASMQTTHSIQSTGSDFQINFEYDEENLISKLIITEFNGNSKTTYTSGTGEQFDSVLLLDVSTDYSQVAYISTNSEKAAYYTVTTNSESEIYELDVATGFVIFADRFSKVRFYDFLDNELYL